MKRSIMIACAMAIGSSLGLAEDQSAKQGLSQAPATTAGYQPQQMELFDSSVIENKKITDSSGKDLGKLERLLIDAKSGQVRFVIVQVDKEWSLNDPEVILPWRALQIARSGDKEYALKIDATRDKLMNAPHFDKALVHQLSTREAGQPIYSYWGVTWDEMPGSTASTVTTATPSTTTSSDFSSSNTSTNTGTSSLPGSTSSSATSTSSLPGDRATSGTSSERNTTTPATTTDGSVGTQPLGNTGTTESPSPDPSSGRPAPDLNNPDLKEREFNSGTPDRSLGGDATD